MEQVRLPDLEVIKRFSIAVRREHASVQEVLEALRADLAALTGGRARAAEAGAPRKAAEAAPRKTASRAPARKTTKAAPKRSR